MQKDSQCRDIRINQLTQMPQAILLVFSRIISFRFFYFNISSLARASQVSSLCHWVCLSTKY